MSDKPKFYLAVFGMNWADEFDVESSMLFTQAEKDAHDAFNAEHGYKQHSLWFGTNEGWDNWDCTVSDYLNNVEFTEISEETYAELAKTPAYKNGRCIGTVFPTISDFEELEDDEE